MSGRRCFCLALIWFALLLVEFSAAQNECQPLLDFEEESQENCLERVPKTRGTITFPKSVAKLGTRSLRWESGTTGVSRLRYNRHPDARIRGSELRRGGVKMWIYKETASSGRSMQVRFRDTVRKNQVGSFNIDLGFKGWRGIWVSYEECKRDANSLRSGAAIGRVDFVLKHHDTIYIDILHFVRGMSSQSRDKIVPPITRFRSRYDSSNFWQQSYRWSQKDPTPLPETVVASKSLSLTHIESRLKNWYFDQSETTNDLSGEAKKRWNKLAGSIDDAYLEYYRLVFRSLDSGKTVITAPPLFCRGCDNGTRKYSSTDPTRKFSFVQMRIMLPLAIEYYLKSRPEEVSRTVTKETPELNSNTAINVNRAIVRICGNNENRQDEFRKHLDSLSKPYTEDQIRKILNEENKNRLERIIKLLDYIEDQGWADGSAIGSLDHEMNRGGAGYMHTLFLLKDTLHGDPKYKPRLLNLINTAKWYNDFGEVYQSTFEYSGTTADRMITIMLFRLMIVLIMPAKTDMEKKERQRDMDALKRWMDNALSINKAFGGVIKPDYTGFHHKTFYASAYAPHAYHTAAQVQYLLEGTDFALSDESKQNLRKALETLRLVAVKYSTPNSVGGRIVDYSKKVLIKILPAYAYISVSHPSGPLASIPAKEVSVPVVENAGMFLRLYQPTDEFVKEYLEDGTVNRGKSYMNSLGSLKIMSTVFSKGTSPEPSPEGHWSKNFAALSVHRRKDWAVTIKGFNRFVWDFEGSTKGKKENVFGTYQSHGSMLIANNEEALKAHDINNGWDWTKIPGATTMTLTLAQTRVSRARNFSPRSSAGGVSYKGLESLSSGLFGMDFNQPNYRFTYADDPKINLHFKKSVFFFQNVLVCLGSNIRVNRGGATQAQTTLFQDKLITDSSFIKVDDERKDDSDPFEAITPVLTPSSPSTPKEYTTLVDTKGNSYYIPRSSAPNLKVHVQTQNSQTASAKPSSGTYGTAWLEHSGRDGSYEYAIHINTPSYKGSADHYWKKQETDKTVKLYRVIKQDDEAHVVRFERSPERDTIRRPLYGYVFFQATSSIRLPSWGVVTAVDRQCRIMAEETFEELYLSISYPDLNFPGSNILRTSGDVGEDEMFKTESEEIQVEVTLARTVSTILPELPKAHGSPTGYVPRVQVIRTVTEKPSRGNKLVFANLKNGFSVEVKLTKINC